MSLALARRSLHGLAVGDAFGEAHMFGMKPDPLPARHAWRWTDDTHMALSVVEVLTARGRIEPDALASAFARRFAEDPGRGYAGGAMRLLTQIGAGLDWRVAAPALFGGQGSYGNGGAMRAAPVGAFHAGDPARAAAEAAASAAVTHAHPEGQAGAVAVAVAASLRAAEPALAADRMLAAVHEHVPSGLTRDRIARARTIPAGEGVQAAAKLGTGLEVSSGDTVPFCLWVVAHRGDRYWEALECAAVLGDTDTLCAIVGGIAILGDPEALREWPEHVEPLPEAFRA